MKYQYFTLLFGLLLVTHSVAQNFKTVNSFTAGNSGTDEIRDITTDAQGNIYITGSFTDSVDFDPGPGTYYLTTPSGNKPDAFIQKLDANGNFLWAKSFRGTYNDIESGERLLVDDTGNVYLLGRYQRNLFFTTNGYQWPGNSAGIATRPFLAKFDSSGNVKWGKGWSNSGNFTFKEYGISFDEVGDIYMVGVFGSTDSVDFDPDPLNNLYISHNNGGDCFIVKISNSGNVVRAHGFGGLYADVARTIVSDKNGGIYIGGTFSTSLDANFGQGAYNLTSQAASGMDAFLIKTDTAFNFKWAFRYGGQEFTPVQSFATANGFLYSTGYFFGSRDFDPHPTNTYMLSSGANNTNAFVQVLDTSGNFVWARSFYATNGKSYPEAFSLDANQNMLIGGYFEGTVDADPNPNQSINITSNGAEDGFIALLDSVGDLVAVSSFGGTADDILWAAHFTQNNEVLAAGSFQNTIDLDPTPNTNLATSSGQEDMLFLELSLCTVQSDTVSVTACREFLLPVDSITINASGFYDQTYYALDGCDSVITYHVAISNYNINIFQSSGTLVAQTQATNPTYQWLDCTTNQIIPGATNQTYMPTANGQYAVIVCDGVCTDTSACYTITNVSIAETQLQKGVNLYPNPTTGLLHIESRQPWQKAEVLDVTGRLVITQNPTTEEVDLAQLPTGIYLVKVHFEEGVVVRRVVRHRRTTPSCASFHCAQSTPSNIEGECPA